MDEFQPGDAVEKAIIDDPIVARRVVLARGALVWERLWPALWPVLGVIGIFVIVSLFGVWALLPGWLHVAGLAGFAGAVVVALWRARGAVALPDQDAGIRRLERTGGVAHRPLTSARDRLASLGAGTATEKTWWIHIDLMRAAARRLRVPWPRPTLAARDPHALRVLVLLLGAVAVVGAGDRAGARMAQAFEPDFGGATAAPITGTLTAWVNPPDYTGLAPVFLAGTGRVAARATESAAIAAVAVPAGSVLIARVHGGTLPQLNLSDEKQGEGPVPFAVAGEGDYEIEQKIDGDTRVEIAQADRTLAAWALTLIPDSPPTISFVEQPRPTARGVLRLEYEARDDYGIVRVAARLSRLDDQASAPFEIEMRLPDHAPVDVREASYHDLTPHKWAGLPVQMTMSATDQIGQVARSAPVRMVLPEREFTHPVARLVIAQRRALALNPKTYLAVHRAFGRISEKIEDYGEDKGVYLILRSIYNRLSTEPDAAQLEESLQTMWDVALQIEAGALPMAEARLREAQEELREALDANKSDEEIRQLVDKLKEVLDEYLDEMERQEEMARTEQQEEEDRGEGDPSGAGIQRNDLQQRLDQVGDMATTGSREQAKEMLDEVQELLENMEAGGGSEGNEFASNEQQEMMETLQELAKEQEDLLRETFDKSPTSGESDPTESNEGESGADDSGADKQEALRRALGDLMRQLGETGEEIPDAMGKAERQMKDAREELERGRPDRAVDSQAQALEMMRESAVQLRSQLARRQGNMPGENNQETSSQEMRDPLGRRPPGNKGDSAGFVDIPEESDIQRSREILNELYRRSGQNARTADERDYIKRLLRWY